MEASDLRALERFKQTVAEATPPGPCSEADRLSRTRTHDELYEEAALLGVDGRSEMSDEQLAEAILKERR